MKRSKPRYNRIAAVLQLAVPLLLMVPNVVMSVWTSMPWPAFAANIAAPLGAYLLLMAWSANAGRTAVLMLPFSVLAAFQVVLLALYLDGSVIAVDMFLNVVTTNSSEAGELLGNLAGPVALVLLLYLPPLEAGIAAWARRERTPIRLRRHCLLAGALLLVAGGVCMALASAVVPRYKAVREVFPVNALCNLTEAVSRTARTARYAETSAGFTFGATAGEPMPDAPRQVYLAVIGETSRAGHYQILGYDRFTTPLLCSVDSLVCCPRVLSESNTTHKSVPMLLSTLSANEFGDSIYCHKSVITAFREAGFRTVFLSMQNRNNSFIDFFGAEADSTVFLRERLGQDIYDTELLAAVDSTLAVDNSSRLLIVLHLYGSHFNYVDRYTRSEAYFLPDKAMEANVKNRQRLVNAYDNSIRCTDRVLHGLIARLDSMDCFGGLIYTADHGEDIFDDERGRFLHASPTATFRQLHVPMILYFNRQWRAGNPDKWRAALESCGEDISSSESFTPTLMHMAGIRSPRLDCRSALTSAEFRPVSVRLFVNDRNEAVNLHDAGFSSCDFAAMRRMGFR